MQNTKNECYSYFSITGTFPTKEATKLLGLTPRRFWDIGDARGTKGDKYDFSAWCGEECYEPALYVDEQILKVIEPLWDKMEQLVEFREKYNVEYTICVVPKLYAEEITPAIFLPLDVIDFCAKIRCEVSVDLYVLQND